MDNEKGYSKLEQTLWDLKETSTRINGLIEALPATEIVSIEKDLEATAERMIADADELERILEKSDHERYLTWLLAIPADSPLFEKRRARSRTEDPNAGGKQWQN